MKCYWHDIRKEHMFFSRRNFGGGGIMVWGAFCSRGTLDLAFVSSKMNSIEYQQVLQTNLLPFTRRFRHQKFIYQQDNATVHVSASTKAWLSSKKIDVMDWAPCSPDLNPMENIWGLLVRRIYQNNKQFQSVRELKSAILEAWQNIDVVCITNLIESMPNRIFSVINKNGNHVNY